ncbi:hypothetical protein [Paenibacillus sp. PSB04]|uniref:hypothetical protein n=1 Tax=Paenibacillus sp. PSB04 TaxID=2866810 RepID=UPI0021F24164|nr:hypothetical protein [Paenibacillus sp. PSB04]UYO04723.1 hypothetical protein K2F33_01490 [Paenibacillus sp. PSB04]
MKKTKWLLNIGLLGTLLLSGSAAAFADDAELVPIETLKPAVPMVKPVLTGTGGSLILSDSPESPKVEGAYYRDAVTGSFRVFWHHQNMTGEPLTVAVAVTNTSAEPVMLFSEGIGLATDYYPDVAGQMALADFMSNRAAQKKEAILQPGESYYLTALAENTHTASGIANFAAYTQQGHGDATVTVTTLGYKEQPANPLDVPILPKDVHVRGTFPHADRTGTLDYNTSSGNSLIRISSAASGPWSDSMPGEYEEGWNAVDGGTVINNGNYGVMYNLSVAINNEEDVKRVISVYDNPSGGAGHYVIGWGRDLLQSPFVNYQKAWKFTEFTVNKKGKTIAAELSLTGGAAGPQTLYFTNSDVQ